MCQGLCVSVVLWFDGHVSCCVLFSSAVMRVSWSQMASTTKVVFRHELEKIGTFCSGDWPEKYLRSSTVFILHTAIIDVVFIWKSVPTTFQNQVPPTNPGGSKLNQPTGSPLTIPLVEIYVYHIFMFIFTIKKCSLLHNYFHTILRP